MAHARSASRLILAAAHSPTSAFAVCYNVEFWEEVDMALDVVFILDIGVQFISGYFNLGGSRFPVLQLRRVRTLREAKSPPS